MKQKNRFWVARDEDGALWLYKEKPERNEKAGVFIARKNGIVSLGIVLLDERMFGELEWEDEPMEVEIKPTKRKK
jgi:hypothetical protein